MDLNVKDFTLITEENAKYVLVDTEIYACDGENTIKYLLDLANKYELKHYIAGDGYPIKQEGISYKYGCVLTSLMTNTSIIHVEEDDDLLIF